MLTNFVKAVASLVLNLPGNNFKNTLRNFFYGEVISERIVEYALCFANLEKEPSKKVKILDIGCYYSNFPIQLASMGYSVTGIDMMKYELTHPNFRFIKGNINKLNFKKNKYDIITCISTLEHIGLAVYGDNLNLDADGRAVNTIYKLLKPGGVILVTVPFGKKGRTDSYRSYDWDNIMKLFRNFRVLETLFYKERLRKWIPTQKDEAIKTDNKKRARGIVFIKAKKS